MGSFSGRPSEISRWLGYCDIEDPTALPIGLAAVALNCDFTLTSVRTRCGVNLEANSVAAGIRGINKTSITGLMGMTYTPENASEDFFQLPLIFDNLGCLQGEVAVGKGLTQQIVSDLIAPPLGAHMIGAQAYNRAWMAFSDLISPANNPDSPTDGMAVLNLETFRYGDASTALDPYGMKPYGWPWVKQTKVLQGEVATPSQANVNGHTYECIQAGTTGATEPNWPTGAGATVNDGSAVWQEKTPQFGQVYQCYPSFPTWSINGGGGSWPTDSLGSPLWLYFVYTYVTAVGETDIQKALVGLATPAVTSESYNFSCPAPSPAPSGFTGYVPTGWNLYIATAVAGTTGLPDWSTFQKWNPNPLAFDTQYQVSSILQNGSPPVSNTAQVVGAGNCDAYEIIDNVQSSSGAGVTGSLYELGIRYASVLFVNRNFTVSGFDQNACVPIQITSNGSTILGQNIPYGPENVIARIIALTELQFDSNPNNLPFSPVPGGGTSSGSQVQYAGTTNPGQWRVIENDGSLNFQWHFVNEQWKDYSVFNTLLDPIATQNLNFSLSPAASITGFTFDLQWLNQPGGGAATLVSAQLSYQGNLIGNQKILNIPSNGTITDTVIGGNGDLWGASLTPDMVNDPTFGVVFQIQSGSSNVYIDFVKHTVYFSSSEALTLPKSRGTSAGPYFYIGNFIPTSPDYFVFPQTTQSDGYTEAATVIGDNSTATAWFSYTDPYLIGSQGTDVTDRLSAIQPYPCVDIFYSPSTDRMIQTGVSGFNGHWVSNAADPETYYGDGSSFIPTGSSAGERAICVREFRGVLYSLRERSGFVMIPNSASPSGWTVDQRWDKVGPCGPRAVDTSAHSMIFVHRSGIYRYAQGMPEPVKISKELKYAWQTVNWQAAETIWCSIDEETHMVYVGVPVNGSTVPNRIFKLYYEEGWQMPIHFSTFKGIEISMDEARRYSIDDIEANLGLRIERIIPNPPPMNQGPDGIQTLDGAFYTSQFLFASSAPDGCVNAITPGIWSDNGLGIDWAYETVCPQMMMALCKIEGANINARGNGRINLSFLGGRDMVTDFDEQGTPIRSRILKARAFDLQPNQDEGITRMVPSKLNERWRMRFDNGRVAGVWAELKYATMFMIPWASGRAESEAGG